MRRKNSDTKNHQEMAWNEPGGSGDDKDPWGARGNKNQSPPDLDEVVRKLQDRFNKLFGGGKSGGEGASGGSASPGGKGVGILVLIALVLWGLTGLYTVNEGNRGVVLRFGEYTETTMSGLHWHIPYPIEQVEIVNVQEIRNVEVGYRSNLSGQGGGRSVLNEALMLTQDENIIDIKFAIQYRIKDARDYLFNVSDPDVTLHQATESAVREIIGKSKMDFVLTEGRNEIVVRGKELIQKIVDDYKAGLELTSVNMQDAQPPEQVQAAFSDAVKAREDEVRLKNEAEAYANDVLPKARGTAARMVEEANAYKEQVIAEAEGDASRFSQVLTEYKKAPEVTRQRMYLDAIESVMNKSTKVLVDVDGGNNLLYLPLDRMMQQGAAALPMNSSSTSALEIPEPLRSSAQNTMNNSNQRMRSTLRSREVR